MTLRDLVGAEVRVGDLAIAVDVRDHAIVAPTIALGGFELELSPPRGVVSAPVHRGYQVTSNDPALEAVWLDHLTRIAFVAALRETVRADGARTWAGPSVRVADGEITVVVVDESRRGLDAALEIAGALAIRPASLARELTRLGARLGLTATADRWGLDGAFALTGRRGDVTITVDHVRRPELRTRISAATERRPGRDVARLWIGFLDETRLAHAIDEETALIEEDAGPYR
jgi:hypothetical protein